VKTININLYPRDGYWFKESDGAVIRGASWGGVIRKVAAYRQRAKYPIGNVEAEVNAQACARNPSHCAELSEATVQQTKIVSLKGRVLKYLSFLRGLLPNRIPWVDATTARNRANVCASCPHNTALPEGCSSCRAAVKAMRLEVLGNRRVQDHRLNACDLLGEDLPTSCHVDHDVVDMPELPGHCWRRRSPPS
jgi:hypothetical protein